MFEELINTLLNSGLAIEQDIQGCTDEEVSFLKATYGVSLPNCYQQFLLEFGKKAGTFMQGTDIFYQSLDGLKEEAVALLKENEEEFELPEDSFIFSMHQGYEFLYFKLSEGDNPAIYQYVEGEGIPQKVWNSFTEFIYDCLKQHVENKPITRKADA